MTAFGHYRGHVIVYDKTNDVWRYGDDGTRVSANKDRPCGHCGKPYTPEGHDPCLGELPGVINACCGHGRPRESYIMFENGVIVRGFSIDGED